MLPTVKVQSHVTFSSSIYIEHIASYCTLTNQCGGPASYLPKRDRGVTSSVATAPLSSASCGFPGKWLRAGAKLSKTDGLEPEPSCLKQMALVWLSSVMVLAMASLHIRKCV